MIHRLLGWCCATSHIQYIIKNAAKVLAVKVFTVTLERFGTLTTTVAATVAQLFVFYLVFAFLCTVTVFYSIFSSTKWDLLKMHDINMSCIYMHDKNSNLLLVTFFRIHAPSACDGQKSLINVIWQLVWGPSGSNSSANPRGCTTFLSSYLPSLASFIVLPHGWLLHIKHATINYTSARSQVEKKTFKRTWKTSKTFNF